MNTAKSIAPHVIKILTALVTTIPAIIEILDSAASIKNNDNDKKDEA